jgi:hypothetical protein
MCKVHKLLPPEHKASVKYLHWIPWNIILSTSLHRLQRPCYLSRVNHDRKIRSRKQKTRLHEGIKIQFLVIMHHRICRPSADNQLFCDSVDSHSSALNNQFPSIFFILCGCGCGRTNQALCISHTCTATFKQFNLLIHDFMRESTVLILSTHALKNLFT